MKIKTGLLTLLLLSPAAFAVEVTGTAVQEPAPVTLPEGMSLLQAFSYTMGHSLGRRLHGDIPELDYSVLSAAMSTAFAGGEPSLSEDQMRLAVTGYNEQRAEQGRLAMEKAAAENLLKSQAFLAANGKRKGVKKTKSGLQYEVLVKGSGPAPQLTDRAKVNYKGMLPDGTVFDSNEGADPVEFPLQAVIAGWTEGLQLMNKGGKYKLYLPSELAYGTQGAGDTIPPNQALVFEVELLDFSPAPQPVPTGAPTADQ